MEPTPESGVVVEAPTDIEEPSKIEEEANKGITFAVHFKENIDERHCENFWRGFCMARRFGDNSKGIFFQVSSLDANNLFCEGSTAKTERKEM